MNLERKCNILRADEMRFKKHFVSVALSACSCLSVFCRVICALKCDLVFLAQLPRASIAFGSPVTAVISSQPRFLQALSKAFPTHLLFHPTVYSTNSPDTLEFL